MNVIKILVEHVSSKARKKRGVVFRKRFLIDENTKILDLGSEAGVNIKNVLEGTAARSCNVYVADIDMGLVSLGAKLHGFVPIVIAESQALPFCNEGLDIVHCSSVIEHVTIPKKEVWSCISGKEFKARSLERQKEFANEVRRVAKQYFVQTPYKYFPVESHTWLPFVAFLPRFLVVYLIRITNLFWIKKTSPDWYLLNKKELQSLFPDAEIVEEKIFGLTKSIMAIRSER